MIQRPDPAIDGQFLLAGTKFEIVPVGDAVTVCNDQRRPGISRSIAEHADGMVVIGAKSDAGHIGMAITHRHESQVFFLGTFPGSREFCYGTDGRAL